MATKGSSVLHSQGLWALRDNGIGTYAAVAELVDNSIQWGASTIHIVGVEHRETKKHQVWRLREVLIYDNGEGMTPKAIAKALSYGGGENGEDSAALGKFGMGLPNASGAQSKRTEVYSWQDGKKPLWTYLDFDELQNEADPRIPEPKRKVIPKQIRDVIAAGPVEWNPQRGTLVHWTTVDKATHARFSSFHRDVEFTLGRIFRAFLRSGTTIYVSGWQRQANGAYQPTNVGPTPLRINDPLYLTPGNCLPGYEDVVTSQEVPGLGTKEQFVVGSLNDRVFPVRIRSTVVKPELWAGQSSGTPFVGNTLQGKHYQRNHGISICRLGREIQLHDFGFFTTVAPQNRWIGIEVDFAPELDAHFGLTNDKQAVRKFRNIGPDENSYDEWEGLDLDALEEHERIAVEGHHLMRALSNEIKSRVVEHLKDVLNRSKGQFENEDCATCGQPMDGGVCRNSICPEKGFCAKHPGSKLVDDQCPVCGHIEPPPPVCPEHGTLLINSECPRCKLLPPPEPPHPEIERIKEYLASLFPIDAAKPGFLDEIIAHLKRTKQRHSFVIVNASMAPFLTHKRFMSKNGRDIVFIVINRSHPFYEKFWARLQNRDPHLVSALQLAFAAQVHAQLENSEHETAFQLYTTQWSIQLQRLLQFYNE